MTTVEELKARAETEWFAPLQGTPPGITPSGLWHALVKSIEQTLRNIKADLATCKETMSPEDYFALTTSSLVAWPRKPIKSGFECPKRAGLQLPNKRTIKHVISTLCGQGTDKGRTRPKKHT